MPAKQAQRLGITVDPDKPPTEAEIYTPKLMPGLGLLGRSGSISETADAIVWLCSPLSNYVTGQVIPVNGGARGGMS
ncbi:MAG: 3-oxoacyl-[acyl-carrier protein] reductase [Mycobacterium sp.]|nr:3-oxoacyl-[acyl-carrier protein] reductase [Mycobacterium sp.]